jgi:cytochrome P450
MAKLFDSMVGAVQSEALRLIPPVIAIPKIMSERLDQARLTIDGKEIVLPRGTFMHFNAVGSGRSRQYWPHKVRRTGTGEEDDLDEFVPERWMRDGRYEGRAPLWGPAAAAYKGTGQENGAGEKQKVSMDEGYEAASFETSSSGSAGIFRPVKGSFVAFSEGARACPGKRFATVELTAILATIFQTHSVELDVSQWASDEEVEKMDKAERKALYDRAIQNCWDTWAKHLDIIITLKLHGGACIPVRFVKRGEERFFDCYE